MKKPAKKITLGILFGTWVVGMAGCFIPTFNMASMTSFMLSFLPFWGGMVASIGINSYKEKQNENKPNP
jgi:hypothetical protein